MSTEYTDNIKNGMSFEDFVIKCSGNFVRNDIATTEEDLSFLQNKIIKLTETIEEMSTYTPSQQEKYGMNAKEEFIEGFYVSFNENIKLKTQYENMLLRVSLWVPPTTDHAALKTFMIYQLNISIDGNTTIDYINEIIKYTDIDPIVVYNQTLSRYKTDLTYYTQRLEQDLSRSHATAEWMRSLETSLGLR